MPYEMMIRTVAIALSALSFATAFSPSSLGTTLSLRQVCDAVFRHKEKELFEVLCVLEMGREIGILCIVAATMVHSNHLINWQGGGHDVVFQRSSSAFVAGT